MDKSKRNFVKILGLVPLVFVPVPDKILGFSNDKSPKKIDLKKIFGEPSPDYAGANLFKRRRFSSGIYGDWNIIFRINSSSCDIMYDRDINKWQYGISSLDLNGNESDIIILK